MNVSLRVFIFAFAVLALQMIQPNQAFARPNIPTQLDSQAKALYGTAAGYSFSCNGCHGAGGYSVTTQFGIDFLTKSSQLYPNVAIGALTDTQVRGILVGIETLDSDRDTFNNRAEFTAATNPADPNSKPVVVPVCTRMNPTVTLAPASQTAIAGETKTYQATIRNTDSVECTASSFTLALTNITGVTGSLSAASVNLAPGAQQTINITEVTTVATAASTNTVRLRATNSAATTFFGEGTATLIVQAAPVCTRANPTVTLAPASQTAVAGETRAYQGTIRNNDSSACVASTFDLAFTGVTGITGTLSMQSIVLAPQASQSVTVNVATAADLAASTNTLRLRATNSGATTFTAEGTATLVVQAAPTCVAAAPRLTITPSSQSGAPGVARTYNLTLTNMDSSICLPSTFNLSSNPAAELSVVLSQASAANVSPGASVNFSAQVTSLATLTANGSYQFSVTASDMAVAVHTANVTGRYDVVVPTVDNQAPTNPANVTLAMKGRAFVVSFDPATDNVGVVKYSILVDGQLVAETTRTRARIRVDFGTHTLVIKAYDAAGNVSTGTAPLTFEYVQ